MLGFPRDRRPRHRSLVFFSASLFFSVTPASAADPRVESPASPLGWNSPDTFEKALARIRAKIEADATVAGMPESPATNVGPPSPGSAPSLADDPAGRELLAAVQPAIAAYHDGHRDAHNLLRVVYFYPQDRDPLPDYAERLDRVMTDVSDFYRDGLARLGVETGGLPLERKDGRLVLHMVRGRNPASRYSYEDGKTPTREIRAALKGIVDMDREHVLVIHGLCRKEPDGRYVFHAPYYGAWGNSQRSGLCHAADCELLDPLLLTQTNRRIVYTEHYSPRLEQTVAKFNSWYLGGIAHELGHGVGLPHDAGSRAEQSWGTSLMGGGNHTYRQEIWGGGDPTLLSRASALWLAAHPLFTGSNQGRWKNTGGGFEDVEFSNVRGALHLAGKVRGDIAPYAVVAYVYPVRNKTDHHAETYPVAVRDGAFAIQLGALWPQEYHLALVALHVNGGTSTQRLRFGFDKKLQPDVGALTWRFRMQTEHLPW